MLFKEGTKLYGYEVVREAGQDVMYVNYLGAAFVPSIADLPVVMARTIDYLIEAPSVSRIVFVQQRNYSYDFHKVTMLNEIAQLYVHLIKQEKILSASTLEPYKCKKHLAQRYETMRYLFLILLKQDPIGCYVEAKRLLREERIVARSMPAIEQTCENHYIRLLTKIVTMLENLTLIKEVKDKLSGYKLGDRSLYKELFRPEIVPNFTFTRLMATMPPEAEIVDEYELGPEHDKSTVTILKVPNSTKYIYHLVAPEFTLNEDLQSLVNLARNVLLEHKPKAEEFTDPARIRQVFYNISRDLLQELSETKKIALSYRQLNKLATILVRHTIGFGLVEVLLQDEKLQDIMINAPVGAVPIFVRHQDYDECDTNIVPSQEDAESWAAKFRMMSGRPLDEANPVLDTELTIGTARARVAIIQQPLSPYGLAYALRRHREKPWTLPLYIKNRMLNPLAAGLLSFLIDGSRTMLIAGTRSSGKCVEGDTLIQLANGDIQPIKALEHGKKEKISDGYISYPNPKIDILSMNNDLDLDRHSVDVFWRRESPEELIKITTKSGKEIVTTKEHPYFIFNNGLECIPAENLKENMLIATARKINVNSEEIFMPEIKEMISYKTNATRINFPEKLNCDLAEFIGYLIGDGHLDEHKIEFTNSNATLRARFTELSQKLFSVPTREIKERNTFSIRITSRVLNRIVNKLFEIPRGNKASKLKIPSKILKSNNKILATFLRAYFDCDGYVSKNKREIELTTASKIMAKQLQMAMLRFGIIAFLKTKNIKGKNYYRILIRGEFVNEYVKKIGFSHLNKKKRSKEITRISWLNNANTDVIPNGNFFVKELRKRLRVRPYEVRKVTGKDYWAYENNTYNVSRKWFGLLVNFYKKRFNQLNSLKEEIEKLNENSDLDYFKKFRQILNIKNEELVDKICLQTVSNFFNEKYKAKTKTKQEIAKKIKKIYKETICQTKEILNTAIKLANSDIFWDKIIKIKKIKSKDKWVYDLTVKPTQNFIANGIIAHNTSLLGACMIEIMPRYRIIVCEGTLELPVDSMRNLGYDVLRMKVREALTRESAELSAAEGIRTSLRLGDSSLIVGEVRSEEALSLYEAMRVGALANVVAGTIHGASPYGVFDRVVNDLKVPATSFKATDIIIIVNPIKSPDGLHRWRRVLQIAEVRKHWTLDPSTEHGFVDLMRYDVTKDELTATDDLLNGESEILKDIAGQVKGWAGSWDAVWDNILLRAKIKQAIVEASIKAKDPNLLEAPFVVKCNNAFHEISDKVRQEIGVPQGKRVFKEWQVWLEHELKRKKL